MKPADGGTPFAEANRGGVLARDPLPNKVKVYITAVLTHNRIFVRSAEPAVEAEYMRTLGECEEAGVYAKPAKETEPITTAPGAPHGSYGRVLLIEPGRDESKCVFVEFGTLCFVSNKSLLRIDDPELKYRKVYVYKVCLAGVTDEPGEQEKGVLHLEQLKSRCLDINYRMEAGNMVHVQLRTRQGASVNEIINRLIIIPVTTSEHNHNNFIMYKDISQTNPTLGASKSILILNRTTVQFDGRVNWIAMDDLPYLETLHEKLQHYGRKVSDFQRYFTPRIGELCLVRCVNRWYRVVCHETAGDCRPEMFLCDYGCMMIFDLLDIHKLPPQLAIPVRTHDGIVRGLLEAKAGGLKLDSDLLDVYLPENEPLTVDISQETRHDSLIASDEPEVYTILHMPMFSEFTA
uniref:Tudor domain-containing protein n=1 Tax=Anopheles atroparvus TaxID=41427 RepID=A0A182J0W1_ANOAO